MLDTLVSLGLTRTEAQAYIFLAKRGPHREKELANALKRTTQQLHSSLKNLQAKGIVNATRERTTRYSAVSLEKVLDIFMNAKVEQAKAFQASKEELLASWRSIIKKSSNSQ
jgi:sugar-specific transcriptional regulator TrmB